MSSLKSSFLFVSILFFADTSNGAIDANLAAGFETAVDEVLNEAMTTVAGTMPNWIRGSLMKQRCGTVGYSSGASTFVIDHVMDCVSMCSVFKFRLNSITYTQRYYRSKDYYVYNAATNVGWYTKYATIDSTTFASYKNEYSGKLAYTPNMGFEKVGHVFRATSDNWKPAKLNPNSCVGDEYAEHIGQTNLRYPNNGQYIHANNVAHSPTDWLGSSWSATGTHQIDFTTNTGASYFTLYKTLGVLNWRIRVASIQVGTLSLGSCSTASATTYTGAGGSNSDLLGYIHYMAMSVNYVIVPINSYLVDPCLVHYYISDSNPNPQYLDGLVFDSTRDLRFIVHQKNTGNTWGILQTSQTGIFTTNVVNAFQKSGSLYIDIVEYDTTNTNYKVWEEAYFFSNLVYKTNQRDASIRRYQFSISDKSYVGRSSLMSTERQSVEFPAVSNARRGRSYTYAYLVYKPYQTGTGIMKLNVKTQAETIWTPDDSTMYVEQPQVIKQMALWGKEDNVLILVPGVDASSTTAPRGMLWILNGVTMQQLVYLKTNVIAPLGVGASRFYHVSALPPDNTDAGISMNIATGIVATIVFGTPLAMALTLVFSGKNKPV